MIKLTFYGGVNEIGGNKILFEDANKKIRILFDFGVSFSFGAEYFTGLLQPRRVNRLGDYFEFDLLPKLRGLYSKSMLMNTDLTYERSQFDGVILSHAHIDHVGHINFLDEDIPIFCGEGTKIILDAIRESGGYDCGIHKFKTFRTGQKPAIGCLELEPVHVDHSIPAAYGFIFHTSNGAAVYTGDFRLHGPMSKMTDEFVEKAKNEEPELMICEGTRVNPNEKRSCYNESTVEKLANKIVSGTRKIVICTFYGRDIDRFKTFYRIAKNNDRQFVISTKMAYLLTKLRNDQRLKIPEIKSDKTILVYIKRKKSGEFEESDYYYWERPFIDKAVSHDYIHKNQSRILLSLDLSSFTELIDIKPEGGHFIHSMSEPFSEEDMEVDVMYNWLKHFNLEFHQIHASGHCPSCDLEEIINTVKPKILFPIHTESPEYFKKIAGKSKIVIPTKMREFNL